eukprot:TRINITY_DN4_c0_g1_i1.p1 TRINITY_DN4_c0_g1~~TRINITY_DN4_c0_g1_i1.p1  ORF type:complete len:346 (+),score=87.96 TRINITY_DN4_c0_g1_i1:102-1139(+)
MMKKRGSIGKALKGIGDAIQKRKNSRQLIDEDVQDLQEIPQVLDFAENQRRPDDDDYENNDETRNASNSRALEQSNVFDLDYSGLSAYDAKFQDCLDQIEQINRSRYADETSADPWGSSKKFQKYYKKACSGDKEAAYVIGVCFQYGVQPDLDPCHDAAIKWYLIAAKKGCWKSVNNIGVMIYLGHAGIERDERLALQYFEQAARHGIREAEMNLTVLLTLGVAKGVQDRPRAFEILSKICSREFCSRQALNNLGCMYLRGFGCAADAARALQLFTTSCEMGSQVAKYNIGIMHLNGLGVTRDKRKGSDLISAAAEDKTHEDHPCIESANDLTKLLMFTTMNSCL